MRAGSIIAGAFLTLFVGTGSLFSFPAFFTPLGEAFHAPLQALSSTQSIALFFYFIFGAVGGLIASHREPRNVVLVGAVLTGIGFAVCATAKEFFQVTIGFASVGIGVGLSFVPAIAAVLRHFPPPNGGLQFGLAASGGGLGVVLLPIASLHLLSTLGWRLAFGAFAALSVAAGPLAWLAIGSSDSQTQSRDNPGLSRPMRSQAFLLIFFAGLLASPGLHIPFVHLVPFATNAGLAASTAVMMLLFVGVGNIVGRPLFGILGDKLQHRRVLAGLFLVLATLLACWTIMNVAWQLVAFALLFGGIYGGAVALTPALISDYFPPQIASTLIGFAYLSVAPGALLGPALSGYAFGQFHSYSLPILASAALAAERRIGLVCS